MGKKHKDQRGKPLSGLAAALVKSGHLDEKRARALQRDQRREDKALGREGVAAREAEREAEAAARREAEAEASRAREEERRDTESDQRARRTIREALDPGYRGRRRWFFVTREGKVRFLDLSDEAARLLADGRAGIVESLGEAPEPHTVVSGERALVTLVGIDKDLVRFWNRGSR